MGGKSGISDNRLQDIRVNDKTPDVYIVNNSIGKVVGSGKKITERSKII